MAELMNQVEQLIGKLFGGSALPAIRAVIMQVMEFFASIFKRFSPAGA